MSARPGRSFASQGSLKSPTRGFSGIQVVNLISIFQQATGAFVANK
jgi:hypothetical protein